MSEFGVEDLMNHSENDEIDHDDDNDYIFDGIQSNALVLSLGKPFFLGQIQQSETIRHAVEDGLVSDQEIIEAAKLNAFTMTLFLLIIINAGIQPENEDIAARCLALIGNLYPMLWVEFAEDENNLPMLVTTMHAAARRLSHLAITGATISQLQRHPDAYHGYDARDKHDYNTQGYDESDETNSHNVQTVLDIEKKEELIMMWLLLLSQIFSQPLPHVKESIEMYREKVKTTQGHTGSNSTNVDSTDSSTEGIEDLDLVSEFIRLVTALLSVAKQLPEEAYLYSIKVVAEINFQFPLPEDNSCEIATVFSKIDAQEQGVNISQGLLHILNENGYPSITDETPAILRLCTDLLYVHSTAASTSALLLNKGIDETARIGDRDSVDGDESILNKGHFYTNDVKVLIDMILREMRNIPYNSLPTASHSEEQIALDGQVRYMYLELIDAILQESSWATAGQCYLKDDLKVLIEELYQKEEDTEKRDFAYALLYKYKHYFC